MALCLGIDTSNYTTSVALFDGVSGYNLGRLLDVPEGALGLRQSDALFQHVKHLPEIFAALRAEGRLDGCIAAVGASTKPRWVEGSYMPCFTVGLTYARLLSTALEVPFYTFSHQAGHIAAALYSSGSLSLLKQPFLAFHVSGGTTEALLVSPDDQRILSCQLAAKTLDLNAGQLIDRVGVMLGLGFPAGPALERLALTCESKGLRGARPSMKGNDCCLSGGENLCIKLLRQGKEPAYIAAFCLEYVKAALDQMCRGLLERYGRLPVVFAGGVMSNSILREYFSKQYGAMFAEPQFSSDNAGGVGVLTAIKAGLG